VSQNLLLPGPSTDRSITRASSFFLRLKTLLPSCCRVLEPDVFFFSFVRNCSLHNRDKSSTQQSSTKAPVSQLAEYYCNTTHQRQLIVPKTQSPGLQPTKPPTAPSALGGKSTKFPSRALSQYHPTAPNHILKATSDPTTDHDRSHNDGSDSFCGVLPCDHLGQVFSETLGAADCRRWHQIQPLEAQVPARKVPHNRPTCTA
jgi:hypothetical protein